MKFGYFDDEKREYVIDRPDTPAPWANYLGSPEYGAVISNNAGGYSFAKSGANGRILRYVFNGFDQPGRYIYIRDNKRKDYWSASWQPVGKDLEAFASEEELVEKIRYYLAHNEEREEIARNGYQKAKEQYSLETRVRQMLGCLC